MVLCASARQHGGVEHPLQCGCDMEHRRLQMFRLIILGLCLTLAPGTASAEDIGGTVRETHGSKASIVIPFELLPNAGDKVSFFSVDPATKAEVQVGTGSVGVVSPDAVVEVTIENSTGEITKDHVVRIHSPAPVKSAAPVKQASPAAATPPLAAGEGAAATLAADTLRSFEGDPSLIWDIDFSPDGAVLVASFHDGRVGLWDVAAGKPLTEFRAHEGPVFQVAVSPDGSLIASGGEDKIVGLRDAKSGEFKRKLEGHTGTIEALAFSADGTKLASGSADNTVRIWNVQTGELQRDIKGQTYTANAVAFSPDGAQIASSGWADGVTIWNAETGDKVAAFSDHPNYVDAMAFSPDWNRAATATDNLLKIWDVKTGALLHTLEHGPKEWEIEDVKFSPDGALLVSADEHVLKFWDPATGALRLTVNEPSHVVNGLAFSPDGSALAIGGGAIKTLDLGRSLANR
jgi:WD40 repeat protein